MEDDENIREIERRQIAQIRELDFEELHVEEVDDDHDFSDDDDYRIPGISAGASSSEGLTFNTTLAPLHTYLGEVEDTRRRMTFSDGGAILTLPVFYLEGAVLFPQAILPLRVIYSNFIAAIERAMNQTDNNQIIAVVRITRDAAYSRVKFAAVGTTAEIRQYRQLDDGSINIVTRGQQRFRLIRRWVDAEGVPCAEIQIIEEDVPLRTPRDVVGKMEPLSKLQNLHFPISSSSHVKQHSLEDEENNSEEHSEGEGSFETELSQSERRMHHSAINSFFGFESASSDDQNSDNERHHMDDSGSVLLTDTSPKKMPSDACAERQTFIGKESARHRMVNELRQMRRVSKTFWPNWVYRMYDSYCLALRAADMWKQIVGMPDMDFLVKKPDLLSFHIGSKIPLSESIKQELLEIDGIPYRLRREIELLENFDRIRCKICQTVIGRRKDMLVMSCEGPVGAYVNPNGYVHEIMTLYRANGLVLYGRPRKEYSWFPGYAWTITNCATCETQMGWLFTATKLRPRMFWGIRSSQVADDTH